MDFEENKTIINPDWKCSLISASPDANWHRQFDHNADHINNHDRNVSNSHHLVPGFV